MTSNPLSKSIFGTGFIFLYCLCTAISAIIIHSVERRVPLATILFLSFMIGIFYCNLVCIQRFKLFKTALLTGWRSLLVLNISTAITWLGVFYALLFISPAINTSIYIGTLPIAIFLMQQNKTYHLNERNTDIATIILIALVLLALIFHNLLQINDWYHATIGILVSIICGVSAAVSAIKSTELSLLRIPAIMILATRLYFLVILAALLLPHHANNININWQTLWDAIIIAAISLVLPLYLLQKGYEYVEPLYASLLMPLIPILTFCLQLLEPNFHFSLVEFCLILLLGLVIGCSTIIKAYYIRKRS